MFDHLKKSRDMDEKVQRYFVVESGVVKSTSSSTSTSTATKGTIASLKTNRATCKISNEKIATEEVRISSGPEGQGHRSLAWYHAKCYLNSSQSTELQKLDGWEMLSDSNKSTVVSRVKKVSITKKNEWKAKIESVGGQFHSEIKKDTNCLVVSGVPNKLNAEMRKAKRMKYPIAREDYLVDGFKRKKKLRFRLYRIEVDEEDNKSMVTVSIKGGISKFAKVIMVSTTSSFRNLPTKHYDEDENFSYHP